MIDDQRHYQSYLLRLWQESTAQSVVWRASLEDPQTGERLGFTDIEQFFAFLQQRLADQAAPETRHFIPDGSAGNAEAGESPAEQG